MFKTAVFVCVLVVGALSDDLNLGSFIKSPSFSKGKRLLYEIDQPWATSIYCQCRYDIGSKTIPTTGNDCGLIPRPGLSEGGTSRYYRIEAEHVVPAATLCGKAQGWATNPPECQEKGISPGRDCAERFFPCKYAISDVHNLFPASGGINADRSDKPFTNDFPNDNTQYGSCPIHVGFGAAADAVTVQGCVQGLVARVSLYMYIAYTSRGLQVDFTKDQLDLYEAWMCQWPTSVYECQRNEIAASKQGNYNHITKAACDNGGFHPTCPSRRNPINATNSPNCTIYNRAEVNISQYLSDTPIVTSPTPIVTSPTPIETSGSYITHSGTLCSFYVLMTCLCLLSLY